MDSAVMVQGMTEAELITLARDPRPPKGMFPEVEWYGMGKWLRRYAGVPAWLPLCVLSDHAPRLAEKPDGVDLKTRAPLALFHGANFAQNWAKYSRIPCAIMGSPFVHYRRMTGVEVRPDAQGTIAFPYHGTHWIDIEMDWAEYARRLRLLPEPFQPVTVCLYWKEVRRGLYRVFREAGLHVVTAGHMYDDSFVERFYALLSNHRFATSNAIESCTFYAVEMGLPFFLWGHQISMIAENSADLRRPIGSYDPKNIYFEEQQGAEALFGELRTTINNDQKQFAERLLGVGQELPREKLARLLWLAVFQHRLKIFRGRSRCRRIVTTPLQPLESGIGKLVYKLSRSSSPCTRSMQARNG